MENQNVKQAERTQGHTYWQWILAILANMTVFSYGLDYGWISPMAKILQSEQSPAGEPLSDTMLSWIASSLSLGGLLTSAMSSYVADRFGRRASLTALAVPQAISWLSRLYFTSGPSLIISRLLSGLAAGAGYNITVMYIKEISQNNIRGILTSLVVLLQNSGTFLMYIMGAYLDYSTILWIVASISIVTGILVYKAPESPELLVKQGKIQEAVTAVAFLTGRDKNDKSVLDEVMILKNEDDYYKSRPTITFVGIVKNPIWRRGMLLLTVLIGIRGLNGAFVVTTYASTILTLTGAKLSFSAEALTVSIPAVMLFGSAVSTICVERMGRKTLNIVMLLLTACSLLSITVFILMKQHGVVVPDWLPLLSMMLIAWALAGGVMSVPLIVTAEMFNFQIRARVMDALAVLSWFVSFVPILGFVPLSNILGLHAIFFIFTSINIFGALFTAFFLPETRGKTVQQIENDIASRIGLQKPDENINKD